MRLRRQLLLVASILLTLPLAGWWAAVEVEGFLRQAQQQTLLTLADSLARSLNSQPEFQALPLSGDGLYVNQIGFPISIDGYSDDWQVWAGYGQRFESRSGRLHVNVLLAQHEAQLFGLVEVEDGTAFRAQSDPTRMVDGDHLVLALVDRRRLRRIQLLPSVPGSLELRLAGGEALAGMAFAGAWREAADGHGYRVEFSLPRALAGESLGLAAVDSGAPLVGRNELAGTLDAAGNGPLLRPLRVRSQAMVDWLARLAPPQTRLWVVDGQAWVLASAGELALAPELRQSEWWHNWTYRWLAGAALDLPQRRDPNIDLRLRGAEVEAALAGRGAVRWEPAGAAYTVVASVAVPFKPQGNPGAGALVLERTGDALLIPANRSLVRLLVLPMAAVLLVGGVLLAYASWLSWRVRALRNAVDGVLDQEGEVGGDFPAATATDEIGDLSRSFTGLLTDLHAYNEYLRSLAGKLSHELNTPLAVVRSSLENLNHEPLPDTAVPYASRALDGAERLQSILRAMSEAQRLEQAVETSEPEGFDMGELVAGCFDSYQALDSSHQWELYRTQRPLPMLGNAELLAQMLDKLVDNARSFAPLDSVIRLDLEADRAWCKLKVANDGPLLPDGLRERLFESLVSLREAGAGSVHLGLGLHMVRLIVRAHQGRVHGDNRVDQSGVVFTVTLPLSIEA